MFFNLIFIILIFNFFSSSFYKSYCSFQFYPSIKILFLFFMLSLTLIVLIFFLFFYSTDFLFNSVSQSNIKFIFY